MVAWIRDSDGMIRPGLGDMTPTRIATASTGDLRHLSLHQMLDTRHPPDKLRTEAQIDPRRCALAIR